MTDLPHDHDIAWLLAQAPSPPLPAAELTDRIVAAATALPQGRGGARRVRPAGRARHGRIWAGGLAASLVAAAAAAAAWDGVRFDPQRIVEAPARILHHLTGHKPHKVVPAHVRLTARPAPRVLPLPPPPAVVLVERPRPLRLDHPRRKMRPFHPRERLVGPPPAKLGPEFSEPDRAADRVVRLQGPRAERLRPTQGERGAWRRGALGGRNWRGRLGGGDGKGLHPGRRGGRGRLGLGTRRGRRR